MIGEGVGVEPYTLEYLKRLLWDEEEEEGLKKGRRKREGRR
jgi:hypothetical protein